MKSSYYENYPAWIVTLANAFSLSVYLIGCFIMIHLGWIFSILYLMYVFYLEFRIIRTHCIDCFYWGKTCGFGKGRISAWFFKKGEASKFCGNKMSWKEMIPDLLVSLIPFITGIVLMIIKFDYKILVALILLLLLTTMGNAFIRTGLTCKYCKQRELGCPADQLFNKKQ